MNALCPIRNSLKVRELKMGKSVVPGQGNPMPVDSGMVHVWSVRYSDLEPDHPIFSALVSPEEMLKAAGFKKPVDARRYILRHGMVRAVLGYYLGEDPEKIEFLHGVNGKPELDPESSCSDIRFSLSCTDEWVCLGITRKSGIGLDIVRTQPRFPFLAIERYLFTMGEKRWIAQAVPGQRFIRFFRIWSLKEALLKATGSSARMMQEVDVAGIMTDADVNGCYTVYTGKRESDFFIDESCCGAGYRRVIAIIL